eukprot:TRINITY_DN28505_c0_g1_i1.p1 TRINITY_DN28505_c0_g1~~TRINITY_DN28505_c0_g1_i1.p1  ORF type:complete len:1158 (+),score=254.68 TRINITY_DN28505_c0_g1_i1:64-3537(+)
MHAVHEVIVELQRRHSSLHPRALLLPALVVALTALWRGEALGTSLAVLLLAALVLASRKDAGDLSSQLGESFSARIDSPDPADNDVPQALLPESPREGRAHSPLASSELPEPSLTSPAAKVARAWLQMARVQSCLAEAASAAQVRLGSSSDIGGSVTEGESAGSTWEVLEVGGSDAAHTAQQRRIEVSLERKPGESWGFVWSVGTARSRRRLILDSVLSDSPAGHWNARQKELGLRTLERGDVLVDANGNRGQGPVQRELAAVSSIYLGFLRPVSAPASKPDKVPCESPLKYECRVKNSFLEVSAHGAESQEDAHTLSDPGPSRSLALRIPSSPEGPPPIRSAKGSPSGACHIGIPENDPCYLTESEAVSDLIGATALITGLVRSPEYNGHWCKIEAFDAQVRRYVVRVLLGSQEPVMAKLRLENLVIHSTSMPTPVGSARPSSEHFHYPSWPWQPPGVEFVGPSYRDPAAIEFLGGQVGPWEPAIEPYPCGMQVPCMEVAPLEPAMFQQSLQNFPLHGLTGLAEATSLLHDRLPTTESQTQLLPPPQVAQAAEPGPLATQQLQQPLLPPALFALPDEPLSLLPQQHREARNVPQEPAAHVSEAINAGSEEMNNVESQQKRRRRRRGKRKGRAELRAQAQAQAQGEPEGLHGDDEDDEEEEDAVADAKPEAPEQQHNVSKQNNITSDGHGGRHEERLGMFAPELDTKQQRSGETNPVRHDEEVCQSKQSNQGSGREEYSKQREEKKQHAMREDEQRRSQDKFHSSQEVQQLRSRERKETQRKVRETETLRPKDEEADEGDVDEKQHQASQLEELRKEERKEEEDEDEEEEEHEKQRQAREEARLRREEEEKQRCKQELEQTEEEEKHQRVKYLEESKKEQHKGEQRRASHEQTLLLQEKEQRREKVTEQETLKRDSEKTWDEVIGQGRHSKTQVESHVRIAEVPLHLREEHAKRFDTQEQDRMRRQAAKEKLTVEQSMILQEQEKQQQTGYLARPEGEQAREWPSQHDEGEEALSIWRPSLQRDPEEEPLISVCCSSDQSSVHETRSAHGPLHLHANLRQLQAPGGAQASMPSCSTWRPSLGPGPELTLPSEDLSMRHVARKLRDTDKEQLKEAGLPHTESGSSQGVATMQSEPQHRHVPGTGAASRWRPTLQRHLQ